MPRIERLCVYCASSPGSNPAVTEATIALGRHLAAEGIELVYGGGAVGLMGLVADTVLEHGGRVTGIIPTGLFSREVAHTGVTELVEVETMHQRKTLMFERSDAFMALPGGFGTLEEVAEVTTWSQIGIHTKPIGLLNVDGFWDGLLSWMGRAVDDRVLREENRSLIVVGDDPVELVATLAETEVTHTEKWLDLDET